MSDDQRLDELEGVIVQLDTLYEAGQDCMLPVDTAEWIVKKWKLNRDQPVPDVTYDMMRDLLQKERPDSDVFEGPSASQLQHTDKVVKHKPPMTSVNKANHELDGVKRGKFIRWLNSIVQPGWDMARVPDVNLTEKEIDICRKEHLPTEGRYPRGRLVKSFKLDGVAVGLYYENGILVRAGLRPQKGRDGEDVTQNVKYVRNIPRKLWLPVTCSIRGELVCLKQDFAEVQEQRAKTGQDLRANARNHATGAIRQFKDPPKTAEGKLYFIGHGIEGLDKPPYKTEIQRAKWANQKLGIRFIRVTPFTWEDLAAMEQIAPDLEYKVDGAIIAVDDLEIQEQLGRAGDKASGNPNGKIAWKFAEERARPVVKDVEWKTGRTGVVKPVAIFDTVRLAETNVNRATLHNLGYMKRHQIDRGARIIVLKSGAIIPKVVGVIKPIAGTVTYPKKCPSCGASTIVRSSTNDDGEEMYELICPNTEACPAQSINKYCNFLKVLGILGVGAHKVALLLESGAVTEYADFFSLTADEAVRCGLSTRQALIVLGGIHMIRKPDALEDGPLTTAIKQAARKPKIVRLAQFIACLGIPGVGRDTGKALSDYFGTLDAVLGASIDQLSEAEGVGAKTAPAVHAFFKKNRSAILRLSKVLAPEVPKTGKLTGKVFCFTGSHATPRPELEQMVEDRGGQCKGSVSAKVDYLVVGADPGSKVDKAKQLGVPTIDLDQFLAML